MFKKALLQIRAAIGAVLLLVLIIPAWLINLADRGMNKLVLSIDNFVYWQRRH
jgi:hypothetical protein